MNKCTFGEGIIFKPDGVHELDPCVYEETETIHHATVHVLKCKYCGHIEITWSRESTDEEDEEEEEW